MKKIIVIAAMLAATMTANAQFESGNKMISASVSGFDLSYNSETSMHLNVAAKAGLFIADNWMLNGVAGLEKAGKDAKSMFTVGAGLRYYIQNNGLFGGVNAKACFSSGYSDIMPGAELGYSFFLNDKVAIEPSVYYNMSFKSFSQRSTVGLQVGLSVLL